MHFFEGNANTYKAGEEEFLVKKYRKFEELQRNVRKERRENENVLFIRPCVVPSLYAAERTMKQHKSDLYDSWAIQLCYLLKLFLSTAALKSNLAQLDM